MCVCACARACACVRACVCGGFVVSLFCSVVLGVLLSLAIILMRKRDLARRLCNFMKLFFMRNSNEHEISTAHKNQNTGK